MLTTIQLNVAQLLKEPIGATRTYEFRDSISIPEWRSAVMAGSASMMRTDAGILVEAEAESNVGVSCSRCLAESAVPIRLSFVEEYIPAIDVTTGLPVKIPAGSFSIDKNHILDLSEALQQYALLEIPMKSLCKPDCKGLCPKCGENLNTNSCKCSSKATDPRWSTLENLLNKIDKAS